MNSIEDIRKDHPSMANWVILKRKRDGIVARNCLTDREIPLSDREAKYLKSLDGSGNQYHVDGFSERECMEFYRHLSRERMVRRSGFNLADGKTVMRPVYIPRRKRARSVIPKILNFLLLVSFLPVFLYGVYLICHEGVLFGKEDHFFLNIVLGEVFGLGGGMILHEAAHAVACLSDRNGRWLEAGIMIRWRIIPGAYVWLDTGEIKSRMKKVQINMAGIEMNLFLAGIMMIMLVNARYGFGFLSKWRTAMLYTVIMNIALALFNISFVEGLDGEHTISEIFGGGSVVDAAKANIRQMVRGKDRREYFARTGINGAANLCVSAVVLGFQMVLPLLIVADISMWIGDFIL